MTTWTKTPPTEPGCYFVRWSPRPNDRGVLMLLNGRWYAHGHTGALKPEQIPDNHEFWPVRIEEPPV